MPMAMVSNEWKKGYSRSFTKPKNSYYLSLNFWYSFQYTHFEVYSKVSIYKSVKNEKMCWTKLREMCCNFWFVRNGCRWKSLKISKWSKWPGSSLWDDFYREKKFGRQINVCISNQRCFCKKAYYLFSIFIQLVIAFNGEILQNLTL